MEGQKKRVDEGSGQARSLTVALGYAAQPCSKTENITATANEFGS